jgi:hypothetical protein
LYRVSKWPFEMFEVIHEYSLWQFPEQTKACSPDDHQKTPAMPGNHSRSMKNCTSSPNAIHARIISRGPMADSFVRTPVVNCATKTNASFRSIWYKLLWEFIAAPNRDVSIKSPAFAQSPRAVEYSETWRPRASGCLQIHC